VKLDRIVAGPEVPLEGQLIQNDQTPKAGAKLVFVNADRQSSQQSVTASASGRFQVELPTGSWLVYMTQPDGRRVYQTRIDVGETRPPFLTLVSREVER
jgi:hypothetical protein